MHPTTRTHAPHHTHTHARTSPHTHARTHTLTHTHLVNDVLPNGHHVFANFTMSSDSCQVKGSVTPSVSEQKHKKSWWSKRYNITPCLSRDERGLWGIKGTINGACAHFVMVTRIQWKPFWLATHLYPQNDWIGSQFRVNYDITADSCKLTVSACRASSLQCWTCGKLSTLTYLHRTLFKLQTGLPLFRPMWASSVQCRHWSRHMAKASFIPHAWVTNTHKSKCSHLATPECSKTPVNRWWALHQGWIAWQLQWRVLNSLAAKQIKSEGKLSQVGAIKQDSVHVKLAWCQARQWIFLKNTRSFTLCRQTRRSSTKREWPARVHGDSWGAAVSSWRCR